METGKRLMLIIQSLNECLCERKKGDIQQTERAKTCESKCRNAAKCVVTQDPVWIEETVSN